MEQQEEANFLKESIKTDQKSMIGDRRCHREGSMLIFNKDDLFVVVDDFRKTRQGYDAGQCGGNRYDD